MPPEHRAKQFMPFAAVKGLNEALAEKETLYGQKVKFAEDAADDINRILSSVVPGSSVEIAYYSGSEYTAAAGEIIYIDTVKRRLGISGDNVNFDDIISISLPDDIPWND